MKTGVLTSCAVLTALSLIMQVLPAPVDPVAGVIRIDAVGLPWVLAYLLFGIEASLLVSAAASLGIFFISWGGGWVGTITKFIATFPQILVLYGTVRMLRIKKIKKLKDLKLFGMVLWVAVLFRSVFMILWNYYFAGPVFFGMSPEATAAFLPWWLLLGMNVLVALIEIGGEWILAFRARLLERFGES